LARGHGPEIGAIPRGANPPFCHRPSCGPCCEHSSHAHRHDDDSGPGQNARPSIAFNGCCVINLILSEPRYDVPENIWRKFVRIMLKEEPKL
jgi:hypothetical protein